MLLKHASVASQEQPMTASTIADVQPLPEFIIKPVSGKAKLTRNCSKVPLRITDGPRFHLDAQLEEIPIVLSDRQYQALGMNSYTISVLIVQAACIIYTYM